MGDTTTRFMTIVRATKDSEAHVMPEEKLIAKMAKYPEERESDEDVVDEGRTRRLQRSTRP